jgi:predicted NBD/HSP70 family sugar kinase
MTHKNAMNQAAMKQQNREKTMQELWIHSPISRTLLAQETGLNKATITNVIADLQSNNLITTIGTEHSKPGRSQSLIMFNKSYGLCAGVVFRPQVISLAVSDIYATILWSEEVRFTISTDPMEVIGQLVEKLKTGISSCSHVSTRLLGVGVGTASLLREGDDMLYAIHSLDWKNIPLRNILSKEFKVPIIVDTGSNNGMVGEQYFGLAKNIRNAFYLSIGYGIGGSILANGKITRGQDGFAGDVGHMTIDLNGPYCRCGKRGCWEVMASEIFLDYRPFAEYIDRANQGDKEAIKKLNLIGKNLGKGISTIISVLNPELVILGCDVTVCGNWVMNPLRSELKARVWPFVLEKTRIEYSTLGNTSNMIGTLMRVIETIFKS